LIFILLISCEEEDTKLFKKLNFKQSGVDFSNTINQSTELNILNYLYYYNGAGITLGDFNNDDLIDIYLVGNQISDKLYINKGNLKFEDVTIQSGIDNSTGWTTGVTHVDINNDGLLDIYICKVHNDQNLEGTNILYINQGLDKENIPYFKNKAKQFDLDISAYSTQSAFFDYDLDGDLDMFLLTHSEHPNLSYGYGKQREKPDNLSGDRLMENIDGLFVNVSSQVGIYQGRIGYGLGLSVGDVDGNGYPDIYVGNDFFENDYFYLNNGDKTFTEVISQDETFIGHTTHYSMGNSFLDVNNDGLTDIISLDMLPEDLTTLKSSGVEEDYSTYSRYLKNGYRPQYMQNTLHINRGNYFSDVAFDAGIAATEWSWGVLAADFDLDGREDLYITNGIPGATNDMDYVNFISQENIQKSISRSDSIKTFEFINQIPSKKEVNYAFKNKGNICFTDVSEDWFVTEKSFSNGSAYGDLDNDGDLDIVVNNINDQVFIYENKSDQISNNSYVNIELAGPEGNINGVGAIVEIYSDDLYVKRQNFPVKSFLSTVPNKLYFGVGEKKVIDSVVVTWSNLKYQILYSITANQTIQIEYDEGHVKAKRSKPIETNYLANTNLLIDYTHNESNTLDFNRDPLVPFALSNEGPGISIKDINADSLEDIFISGAKLQGSALFIQNEDGTFSMEQKEVFENKAISEDVDLDFFDADNDGDLDLILVSGGNEFKAGEPLQPRLYRNNKGFFEYDSLSFRGVSINASVVASADLNDDGYADIIIGSNANPNQFGKDSQNHIFLNDQKGLFLSADKEFADKFSRAGLVNDIKLVDLDGNGFVDIIAVGDWMPISIFYNDGKSINDKLVLENTSGWWNAIQVADLDNDGDQDMVVGNWGTNTRLKASKKEPIKLYIEDIDDNGDTETLITYRYEGQETLLASKDELAKQLPMINKKYLSYKEFAEAGFSEIIPKDQLKTADKKEVNILASIVVENKGGNKFEYKLLPREAQYSSVNDIITDDFNNDGYCDLLLVGNNYEISTQLGRLDASHGTMLLNKGNWSFTFYQNPLLDIKGPARVIEKVIIKGEEYYIVGINDDKPVFIKKEVMKNE